MCIKNEYASRCLRQGFLRARREYSVLGDTVNLAARLMQHATANQIPGGVVCDLSTQYLARHRFQFDPLQPIKVKGKSTQISLFRPFPKIRTRDPWALHGISNPVWDGGKTRHSDEEERKVNAIGITPTSAEESQSSFLRAREASVFEDSNESETDVAAITATMSRLSDLRESGASFSEWFPRAPQKEETEEGVRTNHLSNNSIPNEFVIGLESEDQISRHSHTVMAMYATLASAGKGVTMIIQGEMGMGKSRLLFSCLQEIPRASSFVTIAEGNPFDATTPLSVWRDIFLQLLDSRLPDAPPPESSRGTSFGELQKSNSFLRARLSAKTISEKSTNAFSPLVVVEEDGDSEGGWISKARRSLILRILKNRLGLDLASLESLAAVLNSVMPMLAFRENTFSESLDPTTKLKYAKNLLAIIFASFTRHSPCVTAIDDAVFLDHDSWSFLLQLSRLQLRAMFLVATRPINKLYMSAFATSIPEGYTQLLREPLTVVLQLERCSAEEIVEISKTALAETLGCDRAIIEVPVKLFDLLKVKAQGCPLVIKELVYALKKKGLIGLMPLASANTRQREIVVSPSLIGHQSREMEIENLPKDAKQAKRGKSRSIFHRGTIDGVQPAEKEKEAAEARNKDDEAVVPVPQSLQPVLGCQIDRLTPIQAMALKTGAVAAFAFSKNSFTLQWIIELYPVSYPDCNSLRCAILALVDLKILEPTQNSSAGHWDTSYSFTHGFMRDMLLSRMLSAQKVNIAAELNKLKGLDRLNLAPKLEAASIVGPLYVLSYGDSLGRPDEFVERERLPTKTNMSVFVEEHTESKKDAVRWAEVNPALAAWGVAWFSLHGGVLVMWPSEKAAQAADDPNSEYQPLLVIFPREASVSELMQWTPETQLVDKEPELAGGGGPTIKHLRSSFPEQQGQAQDYTFLLHARYFMWDGCYYHQSPYVFQVGAGTMKEAEAWIGNLRSAISAAAAAPPPEPAPPIVLHKDVQAQEEAILVAEIESKNQNIVIQPTCLLVQKQSGHVKLAGLWKKSWITLTNQALYLRKRSIPTSNPKWTKPNLVLNLMVGEPHAKLVQSESQKGKIFCFQVDVDMWRKSDVNNWERRSCIVGCEKPEEAQKWINLINRVVSDNVARRQRSTAIRTTFALDRTSRNNGGPAKEEREPSIMRLPEHDIHLEGDELTVDGKIHLNSKQKKKIWERGAQILGYIDHALRSEISKRTPLQGADPEGDVQRVQLGIILRDLRAWVSAVLSANVAQRGRSGSFLSTTIMGDRPPMRSRWMEFEDLVSCVDETSREWLSQIYTKQKSVDTHSATPTHGLRAVKVVTSHQIESWDNFDVFAIDDKDMIPVVVALFDSFDIFRGLDIPRDIFENWVAAVQLMYGSNPYHNFRHAVDICQTTSFLLRTKRMEHLPILDRAAMLIAALCHDIGHPGLTNEYQKNSMSEMALLYNDHSVLENHHASQTFRMLKRPDLNILVNVSPADFAYLRNMILALILSTDNANHFKLFRKLTDIFDADVFGDDEDVSGKPTGELEAHQEEKRVMMCGLLHAADISNPCKPWKLSFRWSQSILEEFFSQGDLEKAKGLKVSPNCDRLTTVPVELALNFSDYIVAPLFLALGGWMSEGTVWVHHLKENRKELERLRALQSNKADAQKWVAREEGFARLLLTSKRHRTHSESELSSISELDQSRVEKSVNDDARPELEAIQETLAILPRSNSSLTLPT